MVSSPSSKQDIEQARKNVEWALNQYKRGGFGFKFTIDRMMEMIIGAYEQGQQHKEGYCDFCGNKLPEPVCPGCDDVIHGNTFDVYEGKHFHSSKCSGMYYREKNT
jgi:hypothetical protein